MSIYLGDKKLAGSAKLYSGTGQNTDGAMTQKATTDALNGKANIGASYTKAESDGLLENKASTSLSNITAGGKEVIAHNAMPNEVRRIGNIFASTITTTLQSYTAPADGYISVVGKSGSGMICNFNINGVRVAAFGGSNSTSQVYGSVFFAIKKGAVVSAQTNTSQATEISSLFIYAEGVA